MFISVYRDPSKHSENYRGQGTHLSSTCLTSAKLVFEACCQTMVLKREREHCLDEVISVGLSWDTISIEPFGEVRNTSEVRHTSEEVFGSRHRTEEGENKETR